VDEEFCNAEAVGEDRQALAGQVVHHLIGGGAAIDDDGLAVLAEIGSDAGDGAFLRDVDRFVHREWPAHQPTLLGRIDGFGAAPHPAQFAAHMQGRDVTTNGGFGGASDLAELGNSHHGPCLDGRYDHSLALGFVQGWYLPGAFLHTDFNQCQSSNNHARRHLRICARI
jgi:hypothetical protein